tara:strand:+ start:1321 stop:1725 length:405 start_codon:yes stop_codon:yes gene_type:complete
MYICVTEVDANTKIPCTIEPQRTGPSMPDVKNFKNIWQDRSTWPVSANSEGVYLRAPKYYGTCDDDADISVAGVLATYTAEEYQTLKTAEHQARKPYPSWVGNEETMTWEAPTPMPNDEKNYSWNEEQLAWVEL